MGQIIGSFPVLIISDPCHPWEPDWYSISCVSSWFTELCSCSLLPYLSGAFYRNKTTSQYVLFLRKGGLCNGSISLPAREFLPPANALTCSQWREWNSSANFHQLLMIIKQGQARSICDDKFAQTESQISNLGKFVTSGVPLLRNWCSYLSILSDGRRSPCFSLSCLSAFQCQFATFYSFATPYLNSKVLILILEWKNFLYKPDSSW